MTSSQYPLEEEFCPPPCVNIVNAVNTVNIVNAVNSKLW